MMLSTYLAAAAARPFRYGEQDCFLFLADWCCARGWGDPGSRIRGRYQSQADGCALVGARRLLRAFSVLFCGIGLRTTRAPRLGDIALVQIAGELACGAILARSGYVALAEGCGLSRLPQGAVRLVAGWSH